MTAPSIVIVVLLIFALAVIPPEASSTGVVEDAVKGQVNDQDT
jgi:hypothetical protein